MAPYEVHAYSPDEFRRLIADKSHGAPAVIANSLHAVYFAEYFRELDAKTIVVENDYTDRDYLEDYAGYYVRCFAKYGRRCTRLHFFKRAFATSDFQSVLASDAPTLSLKQLQDDYIGFVVVKPLPLTAIGRTCLLTYDKAGGRRRFPNTRTYEANLYGLPLTIDTLAYQQQDSVVAACATSALWTVFHATGKLFQHTIPSPVEITSMSGVLTKSDSRRFPTAGLTPTEMAQAVRGVGLEPLLIGAKDPATIQTTVYAYLESKIPVLLVFDLKDDPTGEVTDRHGVAVTGFSLGKTAPAPYGNTGLLLTATRIDKLYVHDDQVGPFARMEFSGQEIKTSWIGTDGKIGSISALPKLMLVPLYHKIRIPLETVVKIIMIFDQFLEWMRSARNSPLTARAVWDVKLTSIAELRREVVASGLAGDSRERALTTSMPRFIWRASASIDGVNVFDLLFDATDIEQGKLFFAAIEYDAATVAFVKRMTPQALQLLHQHPPSFLAVKPVLDWFHP